jgi:hypothetical protein
MKNIEAAIETATLEVLADLTHKLTVLRLQNCGHLCIENYAPEVFGKLLDAYLRAGRVEITCQIQP